MTQSAVVQKLEKQITMSSMDDWISITGSGVKCVKKKQKGGIELNPGALLFQLRRD